MVNQDIVVSVLMPAYNVEKYIGEAIQSILDQSYKNFELIIVDDGSKDNTLKVAKSYERLDTRIRVLSNIENKNIVYSLNRALYHSKGKYILRMDGDDLCEQNRLQTLLLYLSENIDIDLVGTSIQSIDENGNKIGTSKYPSCENFLLRTLKFTTPVSHIWLAKRELYLDLKGYRDIPGAEDYDFLLRMVTMNRRFTNIEDDYSYKVRIGRLGNTANLIGVKQLKLKSYVYSLYQERLATGTDSFSLSNLERTTASFKLTNTIHMISNHFLHKGIKLWSNKHYIRALFCVLFSLISPFQCSYLFSRVILKIKMRFHG